MDEDPGGEDQVETAVGKGEVSGRALEGALGRHHTILDQHLPRPCVGLDRIQLGPGETRERPQIEPDIGAHLEDGAKFRSRQAIQDAGKGPRALPEALLGHRIARGVVLAERAAPFLELSFSAAHAPVSAGPGTV